MRLFAWRRARQNCGAGPSDAGLSGAGLSGAGLSEAALRLFFGDGGESAV